MRHATGYVANSCSASVRESHRGSGEFRAWEAAYSVAVEAQHSSLRWRFAAIFLASAQSAVNHPSACEAVGIGRRLCCDPNVTRPNGCSASLTALSADLRVMAGTVAPSQFQKADPRLSAIPYMVFYLTGIHHVGFGCGRVAQQCLSTVLLQTLDPREGERAKVGAHILRQLAGDIRLEAAMQMRIEPA